LNDVLWGIDINVPILVGTRDCLNPDFQDKTQLKQRAHPKNRNLSESGFTGFTGFPGLKPTRTAFDFCFDFIL